MNAITAPDPRRWRALAVLGVAYLMVVLDISIVNVALPSIQKDLNIAESTVTCSARVGMARLLAKRAGRCKREGAVTPG